ncbi:hypothetical protein ACIA8C_21160 [Nocardia sp. NPDC051321]|uniref:hypothetical protein n=1 Tax=Nocardia sp. NPDC051321 TaxID=3364323 RepID=UPI003797E034
MDSFRHRGGAAVTRVARTDERPTARADGTAPAGNAHQPTRIGGRPSCARPLSPPTK